MPTDDSRLNDGLTVAESLPDVVTSATESVDVIAVVRPDEPASLTAADEAGKLLCGELKAAPDAVTAAAAEWCAADVRVSPASAADFTVIDVSPVVEFGGSVVPNADTPPGEVVVLVGLDSVSGCPRVSPSVFTAVLLSLTVAGVETA